MMMTSVSATSDEWEGNMDDDVRLSRATLVVKVFFVILCISLAWAYYAKLDEVSTGDGRVIPIRREQIIQSLEGGIVASLHVRESQIVEAGQLLAQLDPTTTEA